ncbi:MAG: hypothetical protein NT042_01275 [Sulfuritalea sp.]|nr:hypothetical protein [Sulfuritalea sp.]
MVFIRAEGWRISGGGCRCFSVRSYWKNSPPLSGLKSITSTCAHLRRLQRDLRFLDEIETRINQVVVHLHRELVGTGLHLETLVDRGDAVLRQPGGMHDGFEHRLSVELKDQLDIGTPARTL